MTAGSPGIPLPDDLNLTLAQIAAQSQRGAADQDEAHSLCGQDRRGKHDHRTPAAPG